MDKKELLHNPRVLSIALGVAINLAAGLVVLLLAKVCLPETISSWRVWLSLLISVLAVGTVIWLGVNLRMELATMKAGQEAVADLAAGLEERGSEAAAVREQLGPQIEALGKRVDEVAASTTSSLQALEEAKMHEAVAARRQLLEQVGTLGKRLDAAATNAQAALEALKQELAGVKGELAALRPGRDKAPAAGPGPGPGAAGASGGAVRIIPPAAPKPPAPAPPAKPAPPPASSGATPAP